MVLSNLFIKLNTNPLKNNKQKRINPTAAPAAMKGSARARTVIAATVNAEER